MQSIVHCPCKDHLGAGYCQTASKIYSLEEATAELAVLRQLQPDFDVAYVCRTCTLANRLDQDAFAAAFRMIALE